MKRSSECPKCGSVVKPPGGKPYCPSCGWNRESAEKSLRSEIGAGYALLVLIGMGALVVFIFYGPGFFFLALFLLSAGMFIGGIHVWNLRALNQLRTTFPDSDRPPPRVPFRQLTSDKLTPLPEKYEFLRSLPRPRKVRKLAYTLWRPKKRLLIEGEIAFGWVIAQKTQGGALYVPSYSTITYEFRASGGPLLKGKAIDETESFFEEMIIPVFYDPQNPRNNTVVTNLEEIVKPGDE